MRVSFSCGFCLAAVCSSLATAEGVCYDPSCFARARLLLILGYALPTNISLICDLGCGKKSPAEKHRLLVETPNFKRPQDPKTLFRNTFILSPSAHTPTHTAHTTLPLLLSPVGDTSFLVACCCHFVAPEYRRFSTTAASQKSRCRSPLKNCGRPI